MRLMEEAEGDDREHSAAACSSSGVSDLRSASEPLPATDTGASCALAEVCRRKHPGGSAEMLA